MFYGPFVLMSIDAKQYTVVRNPKGHGLLFMVKKSKSLTHPPLKNSRCFLNGYYFHMKMIKWKSEGSKTQFVATVSNFIFLTHMKQSFVQCKLKTRISLSC